MILSTSAGASGGALGKRYLAVDAQRRRRARHEVYVRSPVLARRVENGHELTSPHFPFMPAKEARESCAPSDDRSSASSAFRAVDIAVG